MDEKFGWQKQEILPIETSRKRRGINIKIIFQGNWALSIN
jgi:hypothetical protein